MNDILLIIISIFFTRPGGALITISIFFKGQYFLEVAWGMGREVI